MKRVDLAIIGGGLVGASLALALQDEARKRGWTIALVESFAPGDEFQPSYDARSTALSYGSRLIYQRLGLWQHLAARAEPIVEIQVSERGRFGASRMLAGEEGVPALGYVAENAWLGHCLWQALEREALDCYCPAEVRHMQPLADGYRLSLADGRQLECGLAVLADGGRSALREQLGIPVRSTTYGQSALIANLTPAEAHRGRAFERFTTEGPLALLPLVEERCALIWSRPGDDAERLAALPARQFLAELQEAFGFRLGAMRQVGERHVYPLALCEAQEQVRPHLVLLGNAAHSLHPVAGQGYNLSLRDAWSLAETLLESPAAPGELATLQRFQQRQRLDQRLTVGFSDRLTRLFSNAAPLLAEVRHFGLLGLDLLPPAKHCFARQAMGLGVRR